jgi:DNA replicative helicase MCM subunit Mcm2 (Cdc46/Mcm family)
MEEIEKELEGNITKAEFDDVMEKLLKEGIIFTPRRGYVQMM